MGKFWIVISNLIIVSVVCIVAANMVWPSYALYVYSNRGLTALSVVSVSLWLVFARRRRVLG